MPLEFCDPWPWQGAMCDARDCFVCRGRFARDHRLAESAPTLHKMATTLVEPLFVGEAPMCQLCTFIAEHPDAEKFWTRKVTPEK